MLIGISGKIGSGKNTVGNIIQYLTRDVKFEMYHLEFKDWEISEGILPPKAFQIKKLADALKDNVCRLIGCTREQLEDSEFKNKELGEEWWFWKLQDTEILLSYIGNETYYNDEYLIEECLVKPTPRMLLQQIGTDCYRNKIHPNIHVNATFADYKVLNADLVRIKARRTPSRILEPIYPNWIITDMRFPNELQAVKDRGGISIRVESKWRSLQTGRLLVGLGEPNQEHESETALDKAEFDYVIDNNGSLEELIQKVKDILITEKIL